MLHLPVSRQSFGGCRTCTRGVKRSFRRGPSLRMACTFPIPGPNEHSHPGFPRPRPNDGNGFQEAVVAGPPRCHGSLAVSTLPGTRRTSSSTLPRWWTTPVTCASWWQGGARSSNCNRPVNTWRPWCSNGLSSRLPGDGLRYAVATGRTDGVDVHDVGMLDDHLAGGQIHLRRSLWYRPICG